MNSVVPRAFSALLALLGACAAETALVPAGSYFPADTLRNGPLYEPCLRAMAEPAMSAVAARAMVAFRFTWLRSFDPPIAVRVEQRNETAILQAVVLSGQGGYEPGSVSERVMRDLTAAEWRQVQQAVAEAGFWGLELDLDLGLDGSSWLLEGVRDGEYWWVEQWSPQPDSKDAGFRRLCLLLLELSGLEVTPIYLVEHCGVRGHYQQERAGCDGRQLR